MTDEKIHFKPKNLRRPGIARRAALIEVASDVFLQEGYERASVAEINARAGGSKAFIYEQFGDKAGLFRAVMMERCESILSSIGTDVGPAKAPAEVLAELGHRFLEAILGDGNLALARVVYKEGLHHTDIAGIFFSKYDAGYAQLADYLAAIAPAPIPEAVRCRLAMMFFMMVRGDAFDRSVAGCDRQRDAAELEEQVALAVEWLLGRPELQTGPGRRASRSGRQRRSSSHT